MVFILLIKRIGLLLGFLSIFLKDGFHSPGFRKFPKISYREIL